MKQWLIGVLLFASAMSAAASPLLLSKDTAWPLSLMDGVSVLEDATDGLTIQDVAAIPDLPPTSAQAALGFVPLDNNTAQPGYTRSAWWLRFKLTNATRETLRLNFVPGSPQLARSDVYVQHHDQWTHSVAGQKIPLSSQDPELARLDATVITLAAGEDVTVLARLQSDSSLQLKPKLYFDTGYVVAERQTGILDGIFFGGLLTLAFCALMLALFTRSLRFGLLAGVSLATVLYEASMRGYAKLYLWPEASEWAQRSTKVFGYLSLALFLVFVLRMARRENILWPGLRYFHVLVVFEFALVLAALMGDLYWVGQVGTVAVLVHAFSTAVAAFILLRRSAPTGRIMLLITFYFIGQASLRLLERTGTMPQFIADLGIQNTSYNTVIGLIGFAINLCVLTAWVVVVGKQRQAARTQLTNWQEQEKERLEKEVARQTEALNKALQYADEKNRQKSEMFGYISHDLRAPLATMIGYVDLLKSTQTPEQSPSIHALERSASYQLALIDDLLEYAKHELQPLELQPGFTDTAAFFEDISRYASALGAQQNNQFFCKIDGLVPAFVKVDGRRLQQILLNLISNAAKFTRNGTIQLTVVASQSDDETDLRFAVTDSGVGIDPSAQSSVFRPFEQLEIRPGSAGLGLFIAQRIVDNMGGELTLESTPGIGSRFSFQIRTTSMGDRTMVWSPPTVASTNAALDMREEPFSGMSVLPAAPRMDLAKLAQDGRLTDIENWLHEVAEAHPGYARFLEEVQAALRTLDLERIEALALSGWPR